MSLLEQDVVTLYPEVAGVTDYGDAIRTAGVNGAPVQVRGSVQPLSTGEDSSRGQASTVTHRFFARVFPAGAYARATWRGRDFDVVGEPEEHRLGGATHTTVRLMARAPSTLP